MGYGGAAEAGVSELREHFRETHLFTLSSPDGQKSLSQDPADYLHWEYTQIVDAQTQRSNTENPLALVCTAQTKQTPPVISQDMYVLFLICFIFFSSLTLWHQNPEFFLNSRWQHGAEICFRPFVFGYSWLFHPEEGS